MTRLKPLLLASASPRRQELLARLKMPFRVCPSRARELLPAKCRHLTPPEMALWNALRKAMDVARKNRGHRVLGADTIVVLGNRVLGKPRDRREAVSFLRLLSGRTHQVFTGVALLDFERPDRQLFFVERSDVTFHQLSADFIRRYIDAVPVLDKAGAYAAQEKKFRLIKKIRGLRSNVIGLPIERLCKVLTNE